MSGPGHTWVTDPGGPVHAGSGDQHIHYGYGAGEFLGSRAERLRIAEDHRHWLSRRFVPPGNLGRAAERLAKPGATVLLTGPVGTGRRAAGTFLLHELSDEGGQLEELSVKDDDRAAISAGDRLLLDLSAIADQDQERALQKLGVYRSATEQAGARLVVILPDPIEPMLPSEIQQQVVRIGRPRPDIVLHRYLRLDGIPFTSEDLKRPDLDLLLATAPMREIARLVRTIGQARESRRHGSGFEDWCTAALHVVTDWGDTAARQVGALEDGSRRALLLVGAMFDGAPVDAAVAGTGDLLRLLGRDRDSASALDGPDLRVQLGELDMARDPDGRVEFKQFAYSGAVRSHFWTYFPGLRDGLRDWMGDAVRLPGLGRPERRDLVVRFAEQALAMGRPEDLYTLVERWTFPGKPMPAEAALLLAEGLDHEKHAAGVRDRIYTWTTTGNPTPHLKQVLTDVCRHVLAATHPSMALTRLYHLASQQGSAAAAEAALELARSDRRLFRHLSERVPLRAGPEPRRGEDLLIGLLDPRHLLIEPTSEEVETVWRNVMSGTEPVRWARVAYEWLTAAATERGWEAAPDVLVRAARHRNDLLTRLYLVALGWERAGSEIPGAGRRAVTERLRQAVDRAQGTGPRRHDNETTNSSEVS
ncbi:hypothetical protein OU787_07065 [Kitasatospora sp. YST-16]|uniref:hypothetical protein n=1 Tax=Kitasatospora sp. YST-16 TaxID=2998080 RepID=UPI002283D995|nr:hypothetical protein [Kitasatospora sp. YST-16]WAL71276.1 hypothetical protein OU787_07065 [Kitasatospora sp. YST-16]WNW37313.1 hypothetical protein RKE32_07015 [Streptomyces sp. Li-HN-5-13]